MEVRVNHGTRCCGNCSYWEGNRRVNESYTEVDQNQTAKCGNRSSSCYNSSFNCHHGNCSYYEPHPKAR